MSLFSSGITLYDSSDLIEGLWPSIWMALASFLSLIVIFIILSKLLYFPIKDILEKRQKKIKREIDDAKEMNMNSLRTSEKIEEEYQKIRETKEVMLDESKQQAQKIREEMIKQAEENAKKILEKGRKQLENETRESWKKLREEVSTLSVEIAEKIILKEVNENTEKKLIKELIEKIDNERS